MMRIVHELESVADSCFRLILLSRRKYRKKISLSEPATQQLLDFSGLVTEFMGFYNTRMNSAITASDLKQAVEYEKRIDSERDRLKKDAQLRLHNGAEVNSELMFIDFLRHFEHIGDNALNIAQALNSINR